MICSSELSKQIVTFFTKADHNFAIMCLFRISQSQYDDMSVYFSIHSKSGFSLRINALGYRRVSVFPWRCIRPRRSMSTVLRICNYSRYSTRALWLRGFHVYNTKPRQKWQLLSAAHDSLSLRTSWNFTLSPDEETPIASAWPGLCWSSLCAYIKHLRSELFVFYDCTVTPTYFLPKGAQ